ncbi:MAG TPA: hypothetical protein VHX38_17170 [Pseudonocardiaceae bacterium]|jgi:hypothetical protein|nr:hypothetical protein [Pseudonocardiaceae bacterium]
MSTRRPTRRSYRAPLIAGRGPLAKVPPLAAFVLVIVLFGLGVWLRGAIGATLLALLDIGVLVLLAGTWRALGSSARVMRVLIVVILLAVEASVLLR